MANEKLLGQVSDIMVRFDFEQVHKVMTFLDWKWVLLGPTACAIPTIEDLKACAFDLLSTAVEGYEEQENKDIGYYVSTGGFVAEVVTCAGASPRMQLSFYVESKDGW